MGITIFYSGRLRSVADLPHLLEAVQRKLRKLHWRYEMIDERIVGTGERIVWEHSTLPDETVDSDHRIVEEPLDEHWRGIVIRPPKCEWLHLTFNRQGTLVEYGIASSDDIGHYGINETLWCKTQFGSIRAHVAICELLHLAGGYMAQWKVDDEGGYYDSGDLAELKRRKGDTDRLLGSLAQELRKELGENSTGEIGKVIAVHWPAWRETWSNEHNEN